MTPPTGDESMPITQMIAYMEFEIEQVNRQIKDMIRQVAESADPDDGFFLLGVQRIVHQAGILQRLEQERDRSVHTLETARRFQNALGSAEAAATTEDD